MKDFKLPKEFAEKWITALRSGEYKQSSGMLYEPVDNGFCCLGAACIEAGYSIEDICEKHYIDDSFKNIPEELYEQQNLPSILAMANDNLLNPYTKKEQELVDKYLDANKKGYTFNDIADWIEENVEFYE